MDFWKAKYQGKIWWTKSVAHTVVSFVDSETDLEFEGFSAQGVKLAEDNYNSYSAARREWN